MLLALHIRSFLPEAATAAKALLCRPSVTDGSPNGSMPTLAKRPMR